MKKYTFAILFSFLLVFTLTACGPQKEKDIPAPDSNNVVPKVNTPTTDATLITPEDAEAIALEHAGLTDADITRVYTEYDIDDGIPEYEIEFYQDYIKYEYTIHAETGDILSYEKDMEKA